MIGPVDLVLSSWALSALVFTVVLRVRLGALSSRQNPAARAAKTSGEILLLRPVDAPTAAELENLAFVPPGVRQVVISPFRLPLPDQIEWFSCDPVTPNRKASHLAAGLSHYGPRDVVLAADADVRVTPELVDALVSSVRGGAALCTAAPSISASGWGGRALAGILDHSAQSFTALDHVAVGSRAVCGKACALGRAAQQLMPRLTRVAGEDLELSQLLHAAGHRVELAQVLAQVHSGRVTLRATADRMTRWMQVLRAHRPALFPTVPLLIAPTLLLVLACVLAKAPAAAALTAALIAARVSVSYALKRARGASWLWAFGEAVLLVAFARALVQRTFVWRGQRFRLSAGGTMT